MIRAVTIPPEIAAHFWSRVTRSADGCWLWTGARKSNGYGNAWINRRADVAHRVAWKLTNGEIPDGLFVLHRCDVRLCCRPDHLFLGTASDNNIDMLVKGRLRTPKGAPRRLSPNEVCAIREKAAAGIRVTAIAREIRATPGWVSRVIRGLRYPDVRLSSAPAGASAASHNIAKSRVKRAILPSAEHSGKQANSRVSSKKRAV